MATSGFFRPGPVVMVRELSSKQRKRRLVFVRLARMLVKELMGIAHCGIVERVRGDFVYVIEGNTNVAGSREGDRVMRRLRYKRTIAGYADWLN